MKNVLKIGGYFFLMVMAFSCKDNSKNENQTKAVKESTTVSAKDILGNPDYLAISYGGYREKSREIQPTVMELKEDMRLLAAMGVGILRTYNVQMAHASNVLKAISELKQEDADFEMYVMLGAWIDCKNAWTDKAPDHFIESEQNSAEIARAVALANQYPDIVKVIAVGNEAMVKWATSYFVQPGVILKWVTHLQDLKNNGGLAEDLWITSSDNFASWGGGDTAYHVADLNKLIAAVDFLSVHTYPMHDTHYNPIFWGIPETANNQTKLEKIDAAMVRAKNYAMKQCDSVKSYMNGLGIQKPIHIGETGWATTSNGHYGGEGSRATDEYKEGLYYQHMRDWTAQSGMACFYFEGFDEQWKDAANSLGSENHFGLFTLEGQAKYALWEVVDKGTFNGLTRNGNPITKTFDGNKEALLKTVSVPPTVQEIAAHK